MSTPTHTERYLAQIADEVERVYPEYCRPEFPTDSAWWHPIGPVQPCESCGTRIFLLQDWHGARRWCQVGHVEGVDPNARVKLVFHTPERCREMRVLNAAVDLDELLLEA